MNPQSSVPQRIVVIGGGLAGMTVALHLAQGLRTTAPSAYEILLLEGDERLGGRLKGGEAVTLTQQGQTWTFAGEHGLHGVWGQYHNVRAMLERFQIDPSYIRSREETWVLRHPGRRVQWAYSGSALRSSWIPAPFHYLALFIRPRFLQMLTLQDLACMFRVLGALLFALAYDPAREAARLDKLTLADFFRGWSPTLQSLFVGLSRNFTSSKPSNVPLAGFIAFLRFYTLLRRDAWEFSYFKRDSDSAVIAPLQQRLEQAGVIIRTNARVTDLAPDPQVPNTWQVTWQQAGQSMTMHADRIVLALDIPGARDLLHKLDQHLNTDTSFYWPPVVPTAVLRYWFNRAPTGKLAHAEAGIFTGEFTVDNYFWLHRFQEPFMTWHQTTGGAAVECHVYGPQSVLDEPDTVLLARGLVDLQQVWPELRGTMLTQSIRRNPSTHSLFNAGYSLQSLGIETPWQGLVACGDWIRYPHAGLYMERAVATGLAAANHVLTSYGAEAIPILPSTQPEPLARAIEGLLHRVRWGARRFNQWRGKSVGASET